MCVGQLLTLCRVSRTIFTSPSPEMSFPSVFVLLCLSVIFLDSSSSSRILAVFPTKSHFDFFQPLLDALSSRGHRLTVISSFPRDPPTHNYTDISLESFKTVLYNEVEFAALPEVPSGFWNSLAFLYGQVADFERTFSHPDVKALIDSGGRFDLVITELWNSDVFLGFGHRFRAPVVLMSSCALLPWANARFATPDNPSYIPTSFFTRFGRLDFGDRLRNAYQVVVGKLGYDFVFDPASERIARRVFGESLPPLATLAKRSALLFVNTHHTLHGARPFTPQVIEVGGLHVKDKKSLPKVSNELREVNTRNYFPPLTYVYFVINDICSAQDADLFLYCVRYFKANMNGDENRLTAALLLSKAKYFPEKANNENSNEPW